MKKLVSLVTIFNVLMVLGTTYAAPVYYTFEGIINWVADDAGITANGSNPFGHGTLASYTWLIDTELPGKKIISGVESTRDDTYAKLISGKVY